MNLTDISSLPEKALNILSDITKLRPAQEKAINSGLLDGKSLVICTPTASGKTLIAEFAFIKAILDRHEKAIYIVPLKALAAEKYRSFTERYGHLMKISMTIGDEDRVDLIDSDLIICTSEKLDSLLRHRVPWINTVGTVIIDEIHLLNDPGRGPTLEIIITILRKLISSVQIIGLSATIGNPQELADWLGATLVLDTWRPVPLHKGIYFDGKIEFEK